MPTGDPAPPTDVRITNVANVTVDPDKYDNCTPSREAIPQTPGEGHMTQLKDAIREPSDNQSETETRPAGGRRSRAYVSDFTSVRIPTYHHLQSMLIARGAIGAFYVPYPPCLSNFSLDQSSQDINEAANLSTRLKLR
jgi:hypothetical protein